MALNFVIAGGGTGGHVTPALALAEAITARNEGDRVVFIGSDHGLEARLVPAAGFELVALGSRQVMGRNALGRIAGAASILIAAARAWRALGRIEADGVLSVGGYAAMPAVLAARLRGTPIFLVEPNAIPGRVNRLTARLARRVFVGFRSAARHLDPSWSAESPGPRIRFVGIPLRRGLVESSRASEPRRRPEPPIRLLIFGGSQGARQINETVMDALPRLGKQALEIFHQTGDADRERVAAAYEKAGVTAQVVAFESDMPSRYRWADLALCRAGALTVAELALAGLPAILVPYPFAADDHQNANAAELEAAGAARRLDARHLDADSLADAVESLIGDPDGLSGMGQAAAALGRPDAAREIVAECVDFLRAGGER